MTYISCPLNLSRVVAEINRAMPANEQKTGSAGAVKLDRMAKQHAFQQAEYPRWYCATLPGEAPNQLAAVLNAYDPAAIPTLIQQDNTCAGYVMERLADASVVKKFTETQFSEWQVGIRHRAIQGFTWCIAFVFVCFHSTLTVDYKHYVFVL